MSAASGTGAEHRYARRVPDPDVDLDLEQLARQGRGILTVGWVANALFAVTAMPVAFGFDAIIGVAIGVALIRTGDEHAHVGPSITSYMGDARGHFEGNTLVVETTNFRDPNRGATAHS